jgi:hypothetical protein
VRHGRARRGLPCALAALLCLAGPAGHAGASPAALSAAQRLIAAQPQAVVKRLEDEKLVLLASRDGKPSGDFIEALVIFEQPRSRVMRLLSQTARQREYRPELSGVETLAWSDDGSIDEHRMRVLFVKLRYRVHNHFDFEQGRIWWELDPSSESDLRRLEGFWELYELDEKRTLGRFGTRVDVGPALPTWFQEYATRKNVPATVDHIRLWVDSNGTYRP